MINNNMDQAKYWMWARRKINTRPVPPSIFNQESWEEQAFAEDSALLGGCIWPPRSYSCSFCRREFRSAQALGGHMNVHRRDRARLKQSCSPSEEVSEQYTEEGGALEYYGSPIPTSPSPKPNPNPILGFVGSSFCSPSLYTSSKQVEETHLLNPRSLMKNNNPLPILLQSGLELKLGFGSYLKGKRDRDGGYDHDDDDDIVCNNSTKRRKIDDDQEVLHPISSKQNSGDLQIIRGAPVEEIDLELRLGSDPLKSVAARYEFKASTEMLRIATRKHMVDEAFLCW